MHVESDARKELHGRSFQLWAVSGTFNFRCRDFAQKVKSRGGTLVIRMLLRKVLTVDIYSQYARKNLDLLEQGP